MKQWRGTDTQRDNTRVGQYGAPARRPTLPVVDDSNGRQHLAPPSRTDGHVRTPPRTRDPNTPPELVEKNPRKMFKKSGGS